MAAMATAEAKLAASLSYLVAMRRQSFSLQNTRSIRFRCWSGDLVEGVEALSGGVVGNDGKCSPFDQEHPQAVAVVARVGKQYVRGWQGEQEFGRRLLVADLGGGEAESDQPPKVVGDGRERSSGAASGAPDGLAPGPPFPPADARCTLAVVLSMACIPPGVTSTSAENNACQTPRCDQRWKRL